ncbi:helix-turn-helix domain-containing protein [Kitasatospora aureofaciens]|uniref:helix-turn-helix domain-containing protein n=1 Tax=Kitasatospora aureofaciens TaxID=1894 RepID=UPI0036F48D3B
MRHNVFSSLGERPGSLRRKSVRPTSRAADREQQSRISNIESGGYPVSADRVRSLARLYGCADEALIEALTRMTGGRTRGWWDEYRGEILPAGALDLAEVEHHAQSMRIATVVHIPGLLQTPEHARALFRDVVPPLSPPEVEHLVSHRIKRQAVLYREQPIPLSAVVHETALRMGFGGPDVARDQLEYLLTVSEYPHIDLRVIPFGTGSFPSSGAGIVYFAAEVARLDSVQVDGDRFEFIDTEPQLIKYRAVLDRLEASALKPDASRDLVRRIAQSI